MKRRPLPWIHLAWPLIAISGLLGCRASQEAQAPVSNSATPAAFHFNPNDLRPPSTQGPAVLAPAAQAAAESVAQAQVKENAPIEAALASEPAPDSKPEKAAGEAPLAAPKLGPLGPSKAITPAVNGNLASAASLYVEAQALEESHAYPQAVTAYDRLLDLDPGYADAQERRGTLLELVFTADAYYVRAMDSNVPEERLDLLGQLQQFWPEYRDVQKQIQRVKRFMLPKDGKAAGKKKKKKGKGPAKDEEVARKAIADKATSKTD
jgi:hypothetical protein